MGLRLSAGAFSFMAVDHDGKIRMDCSSPYVMAKLVGLRGEYDVAFGNDPDSDRHGIATRSSGPLNPNHYLAPAGILQTALPRQRTLCATSALAPVECPEATKTDGSLGTGLAHKTF